MTRFKTGDRVAGIFMQGWIEGGIDDTKWRTALGGAIDGVAAEYRVSFRRHGWSQSRTTFPMKKRPPYPAPAVTAWNALHETGSLKPGEQVLPWHRGSEPLRACSLRCSRGAQVLITSSERREDRESNRTGRAVEASTTKPRPTGTSECNELTAGRGVDHVMEVGGAGTLRRSMRAVRTGGTISLIGVLAEGSEVNPTPILMRHIRVQGIYVGSRIMFENMLSSDGITQMRPVIDRVFPFDELHREPPYMETGTALRQDLPAGPLTFSSDWSSLQPSLLQSSRCIVIDKIWCAPKRYFDVYPVCDGRAPKSYRTSRVAFRILRAPSCRV